MSKEENQSNEDIKEENIENENKIDKIKEKLEKNNKNDKDKKNEKPRKLNLEKYLPKQDNKIEPVKQIIKEKNFSSNFNLLKNIFENAEKKNEKEKNEKKERISYQKEETSKIKVPLNSNEKDEEKRKKNIKIEEFKSNNVQRFLLNLKNNEISNKEKELNLQKEIKEKKIINNQKIIGKIDQIISDYKNEWDRRKEIEYSFDNFVNRSSKVKENLYNIEKATENLYQNNKLSELNEKIIKQIYGNNSKYLSMQERIHLFDRKINNLDIKEKIQLNLNL